jgi:hypothetical protein
MCVGSWWSGQRRCVQHARHWQWKCSSMGTISSAKSLRRALPKGQGHTHAFAWLSARNAEPAANPLLSKPPQVEIQQRWRQLHMLRVIATAFNFLRVPVCKPEREHDVWTAAEW